MPNEVDFGAGSAAVFTYYYQDALTVISGSGIPEDPSCQDADSCDWLATEFGIDDYECDVITSSCHYQ
jgi:hypothetical protein